MPPPRSSKTCTQCRARKVKCNSGPKRGVSCVNCNRLGFDCSFASPVSPQNDAGRPERKRGSRACNECRSHKSKCSGELPACAACQKKGIDCLYPPQRRQRSDYGHGDVPSMVSPVPSPPISGSSNQDQGKSTAQMSLPSVSSAGPGSANPTLDQTWRSPASFNGNARVASNSLPLPPVREQLQLVNDFFRHIYPLPIYSFLNEISATQRCLDQSLDTTLLLSLCAVTALQLKYVKYHPTFTSSWIKQAEDTIWENVDRPNIFRTQALVLIVRYRVDTGDFQRAFMLASLAARSASALRLQYERTDIGLLAQEVRRRLMWCLALSEHQFSIGLPECEMCPFEAIYLQLPCQEEKFTADNEHNATSLEPLDGVAENGLLAINLRETMVRRDVMRLKRQLSLSTQPMPQLEGIINEFKRTLDSIPIPKYDSSELRKFAHSRWLARYLNVQLSWNQCHCDIYRLFLSGYPEAAPEEVRSFFSPAYIAEAVRICLQHAEANLAILSDLMELSSTMVVGDIDMAICGYHASRIILFISRSDLKPPESTLTPENAVSEASMVLNMLKRYFSQSEIVTKLEKNLDLLIRAPRTDEPGTSRDSSLDADEDAFSRVPRFALAAKQYQRLGVHSILRQAHFVDDSYDTVSSSPRARRAGFPNLTAPATTGSSSCDYPAASLTNPLAPLASQVPDIGLVGASTAGSFDSLVEISQFHLNNDPFNWGSADNWSDFCLPPDFSAASDGDFF